MQALSNTGGLGPGPERVQAKVTVAGEDILDVRLTGVKSSTVAGRLILPQAGTGMSISGLQLFATPSTFEMMNGPGTARINDDATFEMKAQPGNYLMRMNAQGNFATVRIKGRAVERHRCHGLRPRRPGERGSQLASKWS